MHKENTITLNPTILESYFTMVDMFKESQDQMQKK